MTKGKANEKYGYRRVCLELRNSAEWKNVNHKRVQRLMREMNAKNVVLLLLFSKVKDTSVASFFRFVSGSYGWRWSWGSTLCWLMTTMRFWVRLGLITFSFSPKPVHRCPPSSIPLVETCKAMDISANDYLTHLFMNADTIKDGDEEAWTAMLPGRCDISAVKGYKERLLAAMPDPDRTEPYRQVVKDFLTEYKFI